MNTPKAWKDIWGCGQGIGAIREVIPAAQMVARFKREYAAAKARAECPWMPTAMP